MEPENTLLIIVEEARACSVCAPSLPLGPRPLLSAHPLARLLIVGQAPGRVTHEIGIPWHDRSGDRLREWLHISHEQFYDSRFVAIVPTGFCYPGSTGRGGDQPPRPECAPLWHPRILPLFKKVELTIYLGRYAFESKLHNQYENL